MARPHNSPDVFRAIGHPVRRKMLEMLRTGPRTLAELAQPFSMNSSTISEHVRTLRVANLLAFRVRRNQHVYFLVKPRLRMVRAWIDLFKDL